MANRAPDWLAQAEHDLGHAEDARRVGAHDWACFATHQAAEKAVKAFHLSRGQEASGHAVARLLEELPIEVPEGPVDRAMGLDNSYVPSRYPNSHSEGAPFEHCGSLQSEEAIGHACEIVGFVRSQMA